MRALLVAPTSGEAGALAAQLKLAGCETAIATDESSARAAGSQQPPNAIVYLAPLALERAIVEVKALRVVADSFVAELLVVAGALDEAQLALVYDSGADAAVVGRQATTAVALVRAAERRSRRNETRTSKAANLQTPAVIAASPSMPSPSQGAGAAVVDQCAATAAWIGAHDALATAASQMIGLTVKVGDVGHLKAPLAFGSSIVLRSAEQQLELRIAVGADGRSARMLATHMFGADDDGMVADLLGELGNIFMGNMKASLNASNCAFAAGLPEACAVDEVMRPVITYRHQHGFALVAADAALAVYLGLRWKGNLALARAALQEGMVLASDVYNAKGLLLLARGTRLSQTMIERLNTSLPAKSIVDVAAP